MEANTYDKIVETLQRVKRTETRLVTLASKLGVDLVDAENGIAIFEKKRVLLKSMDVPISTIGKVCRREHVFGSIPVYWEMAEDKWEFIATIEVKP